MKQRRKSRKYSPEFKLSVILKIREQGYSRNELCKKYDIDKNVIKNWERIYLEDGVLGLAEERRGRATKAENPKKGRPRKQLDPAVENDLIAENQRLRDENFHLQMQIDYLKKLDALVRAEERKSGKKRK